MSTPTTEEMREAARELRACIAEHNRVCKEIGGDPRNKDDIGAEGAYKKALLRAHAASTTFHPERKVKEHDVAAQEAAFDEWSRLNALRYELKSLKEQMHSLRQTLSAYQTEARIEATV